MDNILRLCKNINKAWAFNQNVISVFLDLEGAFDSISHKALIQRLCEIGLAGNILNWIVKFLGHHTFHVRMEGELVRNKKQILVYHKGV